MYVCSCPGLVTSHKTVMAAAYVRVCCLARLGALAAHERHPASTPWVVDRFVLPDYPFFRETHYCTYSNQKSEYQVRAIFTHPG